MREGRWKERGSDEEGGVSRTCLDKSAEVGGPPFLVPRQQLLIARAEPIRKRVQYLRDCGAGKK